LRKKIRTLKADIKKSRLQTLAERENAIPEKLKLDQKAWLP